ncbi:ParA family protein [Stenotrophomonas indicatrix]|uniref:ParA family protein n=1 Tax=Stenotrophomonas indicatrix TaxID=2045451 RepID=UPI000FD825CE|nr:ParA family protein [Stenotrophomonas indicatrix]
MAAKIVTIFNNKGGVGKTTLTYHLAHALGAIGKKVLMIDLDPQCNLTINSLHMPFIEEVWGAEDAFIDDFGSARRELGEDGFRALLRRVRSVHFLLKSTEDGTAEIDYLAPPVALSDSVHLIPGRLTLHMFEAKVGERFAGVYQGDPLAIRTATRARTLALDYANFHGYDVVIFDTSPSLGALNRNLLSLADGFLIPCSPDLFSVYGIRNIGDALRAWRKQFETIFHLLSDQKRLAFPAKFVRFMGYTIYNAKKYSKYEDSLNLAKAHQGYAIKIPQTIEKAIDPENRLPFEGLMEQSMGKNAVIHSHNTFPSMSQKYHVPMWELPSLAHLDGDDRFVIRQNQARYAEIKASYVNFARDFVERLELL